MKDRSVTKASVDVDGINKPLGTTGLFLQRLKVGIVRDPYWEITIGGAISVGPRIPQVGKAGGAAVEFDGEATAPVGGGRTFSTLKFVGKLKIVGEEWGQLTVDYKDGTTTLAGELGRDDTITKGDKLTVKYAVKVGINGVVDKTGADFTGNGQVCFEGKLKVWTYEREQEKTCLVDSTLRFSSKQKQTAFTACGRIDLGFTKHFGWGIKYPADGKPPKIDVIAGSCDVDEWHAAPASAAQAIGGAHSLSVGRGLDAAVIGDPGRRWRAARGAARPGRRCRARAGERERDRPRRRLRADPLAGRQLDLRRSWPSRRPAAGPSSRSPARRRSKRSARPTRCRTRP